jgi:3'-phosphoadenosine 5'-phosphosulfate sulfotransferase (PAPS reductase)/FAD synthetase
MRHIVAISGGKDSTAMALRLAEIEPRAYEFCITPTGRELPVMLEHWANIEKLLGQPLIRVPAPTLMELILKFKALPNFRMRWCTRMVKIEPFMAYALGHTFRSEQRDSWPASMTGLRKEFEAGRIPKDTRLQKERPRSDVQMVRQMTPLNLKEKQDGRERRIL